MDIRVFPDADAAVEHAVSALREACAARGEGPVSIVLAGGSTPVRLHRRLAEARGIPWPRIRIFLGDERAVPPNHPDSNFRAAVEALLSRIDIDPSRVHRMEGESADLEAAARRYEQGIIRAVPVGPSGLPEFDLVWLGLGPDGHTASLFPEATALEETDRLVTVAESPSGVRARLSMTLPLLAASRLVQFLVLGSEKAQVVRAVLGAPWQLGPEEGAAAERTPAARVGRRARRAEWILDRDAAAAIQESDLLAGGSDDGRPRPSGAG